AMAVVGKAGSLQVVVGPQADRIADEIRRALPFDTQPGEAVPPLGSPHTAEEVVAMQATVDAAEAQAWLGALGGAGNLREVRDVALTRRRVSATSRTSRRLPAPPRAPSQAWASAASTVACIATTSSAVCGLPSGGTASPGCVSKGRARRISSASLSACGPTTTC
ncbi:hypothetical protein ACV34S_34685, partial [Pseudomonas aeruginosa]